MGIRLRWISSNIDDHETTLSNEMNYRSLIEPLYYQVYGAGKYDVLDKILHPDFVNHLPAGKKCILNTI